MPFNKLGIYNMLDDELENKLTPQLIGGYEYKKNWFTKGVLNGTGCSISEIIDYASSMEMYLTAKDLSDEYSEFIKASSDYKKRMVKDNIAHEAVNLESIQRSNGDSETANLKSIQRRDEDSEESGKE